VIQLFLLGAGALMLIGGIVASVRERQVEWRALLGGIALLGAAVTMTWLPALLHGSPQ
jgi:hypothetical protein